MGNHEITEQKFCVTCGIDIEQQGLKVHRFWCSGCGEAIYQCEFCHAVMLANMYRCPRCKFVGMIPNFKNKIFSLTMVDQLCYFFSLIKLRRHMSKEKNLDDIVDTAYRFRGYGFYRTIRPAQIRSEIIELATLVRSHHVETKVILEIGTGQGGTLYIWSRYLKPYKVICIDNPGGLFGGGFPAQKIRFLSKFSPQTEFHFLREDSHQAGTLQKVVNCLQDSSVDFLFIDGDHTYNGVKQDFNMYSPLVRDGGIVALHDIAHRLNDVPDSLYGVKRFWQELRKRFRYSEIVASQDHRYGIGLVYV